MRLLKRDALSNFGKVTNPFEPQVRECKYYNNPLSAVSMCKFLAQQGY